MISLTNMSVIFPESMVCWQKQNSDPASDPRSKEEICIFTSCKNRTGFQNVDILQPIESSSHPFQPVADLIQNIQPSGPCPYYGRVSHADSHTGITDKKEAGTFQPAQQNFCFAEGGKWTGFFFYKPRKGHGYTWLYVRLNDLIYRTFCD